MIPTRLQRAVVTAVVVVAACAPKVDTSWHQEQGYRWHALAIPRRGHAGFSLLRSSKTGITHANVIDDEHALANRNLLIGAGAATGDVDGDGLPDVFLASMERPAALYHNDGGMRFTDVTAKSGIDTRGLATSCAAFADVNGDGNLDLVVGTLGGPIKLWLGDGKGHFTDATPTSGFVSGYAATALTLADVDGDGDLDLYVGTYKARSALDAYSPQDRAFDKVVKKVDGKYVVLDQWQKEYRAIDRPDLGGVLRSQRADPDLFFINDGSGHFTRTPISGARFLDEDGKPLAQEPDYFTLAARFYDVNGDGAPDLYVCNDFEDPDQFWINDGKGNFRMASWAALRQTSNTCMSVDFADINRDGVVDFFTADMMSPTLAERQRQIPTHMPIAKPVGFVKDRAQWMRNALQLGRGDGTWAEIADFSGVAATDWTWGSAFLDVDLDGYEDLLTLNGHRWDVRDADTFDRIRNSSPRVPWNREQGMFPKDAVHSIALRNNGDLTFANANTAWGFGADAAISQGIALADLDGDGALDVVATRLDEAPVIYHNEAGAPRIAVRLKGTGPNTRGIGATVSVGAASLPVQSREMTAGGYYLSGSDAELVFATGKDSVVTIEVRWRSGRVSTIATARPNRLYEIDESAASDSRPVYQAGDATDSGATLFQDATPLLGGHVHVDSLFDDFQRQPLLPNRFSQLGPGVSWIDVDGDGREDLVVGTGRGGRLAVLHNEGPRFRELKSNALVARWDLTTILPVSDKAGRVLLVAGQSNYESSSPSEALSVPSVIASVVGGGVVAPPVPLAPAESASVGPLALADVNGDGRLDLFVGARVVPGAWPLPAPSRLYLRTADGGWAADTINAPVLRTLGIISSALFTDVDGDRRPDLVVTAEWGPVRLLHNEGGRFRDVTKEWGLSGRNSRWTGLAAGDFDGDGRIDLIATSYGRNTPWHASSDRPYELIVGNFGGDGMGLVFAQRDSQTGKEMPLQPFTQLGVAIPQVREHVATFADYSRATVDDVLGAASQSAIRVGATTFDHIVLLNRGGRFDARSLPTMAQLAPAFGTVVADFDGDGHEDVFLAQNFFPTELETPRFDAGVGLLLLGDGRGGFAPVGVKRSGISISGDQRGAAAADYDGDGRVDLAVSQNGGATTLWHNAGGTPGIRVRLHAGADNPFGIGAQLRVIAGTTRGPLREIHAGSGYWSMDGATTVMARPRSADSLWVRWPNGAEQTIALGTERRDLRLEQPRGR
ncbi:MAG TPA: FG-GAP-like repeat-containing protein [Gemmatimonadaceae bacterium]|nr:FG-GAP-like repeat-containing protein [Gemmatimonadaceae bacterium]